MSAIKNHKIFVILVLAVLLFMYSNPWELLYRRGPNYKGKSIHTWSTRYAKDLIVNGKNVPDDEVAIRAIGTNAIPILLNECFTNDSQLKSIMLSICPRSVRWQLNLFTGEERETIAAESLQVLGPQAEGAIPILASRLKNSDPKIRYQTTWLLGEIGPSAAGAIPTLIDHMYDPNENVQFGVRHALGSIHRRMDLIVPALIESLDASHRTNYSFMASIVVLGDLGFEAKSAIPYLLPDLTNSNPVIRLDTTNAVEQIEARPVSPHY